MRRTAPDDTAPDNTGPENPEDPGPDNEAPDNTGSDDTAGSTRGASKPVATSARRGTTRPINAGTAVASTVLDICCVLLFVALGRHTHHNGDTVAGIWHTSWPFLAGLAVGLVLARAWRKPLSIIPAGIGAWLGAAVAGMLIRVLAGQGTAFAFIGVTLAFLALFVLGWRVAARIVSTRLRASGLGYRR